MILIYVKFYFNVFLLLLLVVDFKTTKECKQDDSLNSINFLNLSKSEKKILSGVCISRIDL